MPMSTLAARPLVGSEPPHSVPTISSVMGNSSFWSMEASATISLAYRTPSSTAFSVPPASWMMTCLMGLLVRSWMALTTRSIWQFSQPRDTTTVPYTLGLAA